MACSEGCSKSTPTRDTTEVDRFQGVWAVESVETGAEVAAPTRERLAGLRFHVRGNRFTFGEGTDLRPGHVIKAVEESIPLSSTMGEEIGRLREWSKTRTRPASTAQRLAVVR